MIPGFKKRLLQELQRQIKNNEEFAELRVIKDLIKIPDSVFAPNIATWVGASILMNLQVQ